MFQRLSKYTLSLTLLKLNNRRMLNLIFVFHISFRHETMVALVRNLSFYENSNFFFIVSAEAIDTR